MGNTAFYPLGEDRLDKAGNSVGNSRVGLTCREGAIDWIQTLACLLGTQGRPLGHVGAPICTIYFKKPFHVLIMNTWTMCFYQMFVVSLFLGFKGVCHQQAVEHLIYLNNLQYEVLEFDRGRNVCNLFLRSCGILYFYESYFSYIFYL